MKHEHFTPSEAFVCRSIVDRNQVMRDQIAAVLVEQLGADVTREKLENLISNVQNVADVASSNLVDVVSKHFSGK